MSTLDITFTDDTISDSKHARRSPALVVLWSREADREGEVAHIDQRCVLGRGPGEGEARALFVRQRPGFNERRPLLKGARISRRQLDLRPRGDDLVIENIGRCRLKVNGKVVDKATVGEGDVLELRKGMVLRVTTRQWEWPESELLTRRDWPDWGKPDAHGIVGESAAIWQLRERIAFLGPRAGHVVILGASGSGKELVARALHACSERSGRALVSRNAATIPEGLMDAELFGNIEDYPNPGMPARPGLVGEANHSTLFLDEIAEIPPSMHAHLLRLMDGDGEYHRLGESKVRHADIRMVAATNRPPKDLKHDLLARFRLRMQVAGLNERIDDLPFLIAHLLRLASEDDPFIRERCFGRDGRPNVDAELVASLARHHFSLHVRELDTILWRQLTDATDSGLQALEPFSPDVQEPTPTYTDPRSLSRDDIAAALDAQDGVLKNTWPALGLKNRFQLIRLLKKHKLGSYAE